QRTAPVVAGPAPAGGVAVRRADRAAGPSAAAAVTRGAAGAEGAAGSPGLAAGGAPAAGSLVGAAGASRVGGAGGRIGGGAGRQGQREGESKERTNDLKWPRSAGTVQEHARRRHAESWSQASVRGWAEAETHRDNNV